MARKVKDDRLGSRSSRLRLTARNAPYWTHLTGDLFLGYRKGTRVGSWLVRFLDPDTKLRVQDKLGTSDDIADADGKIILSADQAQEAARAWLAKRALGERPTEPYTVKAALGDYLAAYEAGRTAKGTGRATDRTKAIIDARIVPALGSVLVSKLTKKQIQDWHAGLAKSPPRLRTKAGEAQKFAATEDSPEALRRRKSTANRILTVLKAALNYAHQEDKVPSDDAWRNVKPFRNADAARIRYLSDEEARRLVNACSEEFRPLVQAAILTGCRLGELTALTVEDFNRDSQTVHVRTSKNGKPRHVVLTEEGFRFFTDAVAGKLGKAPIFAKADGAIWGKSHQQRPFKTAVSTAKLDPLAFHELRHTYASRLVMKGVPLMVVAQQLGHSDTRMVEKHYGHLSPSYVADTVRAAFTDMGIFKENNVVSMG